jgi:hypothetical protein
MEVSITIGCKLIGEGATMSGPTTATIKQLFAVSGNRCAFPGCNLPLVDAGSSTVLGEICHIKARSPDGPRYDPAQAEEERHAFGNLLLLCPAHHKIVDDNPGEYTVEWLLETKTQHEAQTGGGPDLTDEVAHRLERQLEIHGDVSGQVAVGSDVFQIGDVQGSTINITMPGRSDDRD